MVTTPEQEEARAKKVEELNAGTRQPRNPMDVVSRIIDIIPPTETALIGDLESVQRRLLFAAPEILQNYWGYIEEALEKHLGEVGPDWKPDGWQWRVGRIMRAEEE